MESFPSFHFGFLPFIAEIHTDRKVVADDMVGPRQEYLVQILLSYRVSVFRPLNHIIRDERLESYLGRNTLINESIVMKYWRLR